MRSDAPVDEVLQWMLTFIREATVPDPSEGLVVGIKRRRSQAMAVCNAYRALPTPAREQAMVQIATQLKCCISLTDLAAACLAPAGPLAGSRSVAAATALRDRLTPTYERFFVLVASVPQGVAFLLEFRGELQGVLRQRGRKARGAVAAHELACLRAMDECVRQLFATQQAVQFRRIGPGDVDTLRFMQLKEAVHPMRGAGDLLRRVAGTGRACFGLFHPSLPHQPLVFVEIALTDRMSRCAAAILDGSDRAQQPEQPQCAVFYSITNTQPGLAGLQLATHAIFLAIDRTAAHYPSCQQFCTLSPVPGFRAWLQVRLCPSERVLVLLAASHPRPRQDRLRAQDPSLFRRRDMRMLVAQSQAAGGTAACPYQALEHMIAPARWHEWTLGM